MTQKPHIKRQRTARSAKIKSLVKKALKNGFKSKPAKGKNCWEIFYDQVGIPYEVRKDYFYLERSAKQEENLLKKKNPNGEPFIFIHDDKSRGFKINKKHLLNDKLLVIENDVSENIFNFIGVVKKAEEVHCMESSFKTLVDIYCDQEKLFFHDFRGHPLGLNSNKNWKELKEKLPDEFAKAVKIDEAIRDSSKKGLKEPIYLHRSCTPLERVDFGDQLEMFMCEEGFCGL